MGEGISNKKHLRVLVVREFICQLKLGRVKINKEALEAEFEVSS